MNAFGCCAGPMQFSVVGSPSTWDRYGVDGNGDGRTSPYDPADAIPAAARYLRASGAPADYRRALFAYNHADWYVADVLAKAAEYRGPPRGSPPLPNVAATVHEVLRDARITLTTMQRADLAGGLVDPRLVSTLAAIARRHTVVVTSLRSDHSTYTVDGNLSNHAAGRAMDIGAVDGEICRGTRTGRLRGSGPRAGRRRRPAARDGAHLLLGPGRSPRSPRLRARRPLRPHPLGDRLVGLSRGRAGTPPPAPRRRRACSAMKDGLRSSLEDGVELAEHLDPAHGDRLEVAALQAAVGEQGVDALDRVELLLEREVARQLVAAVADVGQRAAARTRGRAC